MRGCDTPGTRRDACRTGVLDDGEAGTAEAGVGADPRSPWYSPSTRRNGAATASGWAAAPDDALDAFEDCGLEADSGDGDREPPEVVAAEADTGTIVPVASGDRRDGEADADADAAKGRCGIGPARGEPRGWAGGGGGNDGSLLRSDMIDWFATPAFALAVPAPEPAPEPEPEPATALATRGDDWGDERGPRYGEVLALRWFAAPPTAAAAMSLAAAAATDAARGLGMRGDEACDDEACDDEASDDEGMAAPAEGEEAAVAVGDVLGSGDVVWMGDTVGSGEAVAGMEGELDGCGDTLLMQKR